MCCRWAEQRGREETDRWKKRARTRGWPREFERSVKGFDCCAEKGDTPGENEARMAQNDTEWPLRDDGRMDTVTCGGRKQQRETWRDSKGTKMVEKETTGKRRRSREYFDEWILKAYEVFWKVRRSQQEDRISKPTLATFGIYRHTGNTWEPSLTLLKGDWPRTASGTSELSGIMTWIWELKKNQLQSITWYYCYEKHGSFHGNEMQMPSLCVSIYI